MRFGQREFDELDAENMWKAPFYVTRVSGELFLSWNGNDPSPRKWNCLKLYAETALAAISVHNAHVLQMRDEAWHSLSQEQQC